jgi:hypothetical protein
LVDHIGVTAWEERRKAIESRLAYKLEALPGTTPVEGISIRDRSDEIGWYLYLAEQSIADPPSLETDQASRVLPYLNALGRNLESILQVKNIESRIRRLVLPTPNQDPDQVIFELLVGARYVDEGWEVEAIPESQSRTPDFLVKRGTVELDVECKRLTRRAEYSEKERDAWLRQWEPAQRWLVNSRIPLITTIIFHAEVASFPRNYILDLLQQNIARLTSKEVVVDQDNCTIWGNLADLDAIQSILAANYVKCSGSRERQVITGQHIPYFGLTYVVGGSRVKIGSRPNNFNLYWDHINFVAAAYWRCDAEASIEAKARNVIKRLSSATDQLSGGRPGIVHIGIEASEGD